MGCVQMLDICEMKRQCVADIVVRIECLGRLNGNKDDLPAEK
jgi:hypothetical protein